MGKDMQFSPLNFLIGSGGPEMISNNNNDIQKIADDDSGSEGGGDVVVTGGAGGGVRGKGRGYNNCSAEHDMMTALGLSFTAAAQQDKGDSRLSTASGPTADVMAALGLSYSGNSGVDSLSPATAIKSEVAVEGAE